jgi:hypothetical protein
MAVVDGCLNLCLSFRGYHGDGGSQAALGAADEEGEQQGENCPGLLYKHYYYLNPEEYFLSATRQ